MSTCSQKDIMIDEICTDRIRTNAKSMCSDTILHESIHPLVRMWEGNLL